jgi:hypothetical protein
MLNRAMPNLHVSALRIDSGLYAKMGIRVKVNIDSGGRPNTIPVGRRTVVVACWNGVRLHSGIAFTFDRIPQRTDNCGRRFS